MTENVTYWADLSDYDIETAEAMLFSEPQRDFIDLLEPLNIEARYPTHKEQLMKSLTEKRCLEILKNAQELQRWIAQKL